MTMFCGISIATKKVAIFFRKERDMWKPVVGYEGFYEVSDQGEVRRILNGKTRNLKLWQSANYYTVCLSKNCQRKTKAVHRLVADAFLDKPDNAEEVNHKDGNKLNNRVENLEWVTQKENMIHSIEVLGNNPFGKPPKKVKCIDPNTGEVIAEYRSLLEAGKAMGNASARASITLVCQGYQASAYGYRWEYAD